VLALGAGIPSPNASEVCLKRSGITKITLGAFFYLFIFFITPALSQTLPNPTSPDDILQESFIYPHSILFGNYFETLNSNYGTSIINSFKENTGLFNLNQSAGNINNQSNLTVITLTPDSKRNILSLIGLSGIDISSGNTIKYSGTISRQSLIENSFENSKGVFLVNQSPGSLNQQSNALILSLGVGSALMLSDFELAASLSENSIQYEPGTVLESKDAINNSFSGMSGIVIINQSSGDLNIIRNNIGISFSKEIR
jgi:hypothetical protein